MAVLVAALALLVAPPAGAQVVTGPDDPAVVGPNPPVLTLPEEADLRLADELGSDGTSRAIVLGAVVLVALTLGAAGVAMSGWRP